jgi:hypothetical protein
LALDALAGQLRGPVPSEHHPIMFDPKTRKEESDDHQQKDASKAGKLLRDPKVPKSIKSVAGSDVSQAKRKGKN